MNKTKYCILLSIKLYSLSLFSQNINISEYILPEDTIISYRTFTESKTYKFNGFDSAKLQLVQTIKYDENGNEIEILWKDFINFVDGKTLNIFDTRGLKVQKYFVEMSKHDKDKLEKTFFEYHPNGKLKKTIQFSYKKRIRKDVDRGDGPYYAKDLNKYKSWQIGKTWNYEYNKENRLAKKYTPVIAYSQEIYTYDYDSRGRMIKESYLIDSKKKFEVDYNYFKDSSQNFITWYDYEGNKDTSDTIKKYYDTIHKQKYDSNGNILEELVIERKDGSVRNRDKRWYDNKNRIIRHEIYYGIKLIETYIYEYDDIKKSKEYFLTITKE